jgi:hypothetical protein
MARGLGGERGKTLAWEAVKLGMSGLPLPRGSLGYLRVQNHHPHSVSQVTCFAGLGHKGEKRPFADQKQD